MPGPDGGLRWSVMLHYDTASGGFLTHYTTWEAAISPGPGSLQQVFTPGAHSATLQQAGLTDRLVKLLLLLLVMGHGEVVICCLAMTGRTVSDT